MKAIIILALLGVMLASFACAWDKEHHDIPKALNVAWDLNRESKYNELRFYEDIVGTEIKARGTLLKVERNRSVHINNKYSLGSSTHPYIICNWVVNQHINMLDHQDRIIATGTLNSVKSGRYPTVVLDDCTITKVE